MLWSLQMQSMNAAAIAGRFYKTSNSISCRLRLFRKSSIQKGNVHLIGDDVTASDLDRYTFSNAMAHSVKLGTWEALLEEYIDSVEVVTQVSFYVFLVFMLISFQVRMSRNLGGPPNTKGL